MRSVRSLILFLAAALLAVSAAACGGSAPRPAVHAVTVTVARTVPLQTMFEAQGQLLRDPVPTFARLQAFGVDSVRIFVPWSSLAPDPTSRTAPAGFSPADPAAYPASAWTPYDGAVRSAAAHHIAVDFTLEGPPPLWASGPGMPAGTHPQWRPDPAAYRAFVHAIASRYSGAYAPAGGTVLPRVSMWSVWNEPNYGPQLAPQAIDHSTVETAPAIYRGLLDAAWSALQATGHGSDTILIGELAPRGLTTGDNPGNFSGMVPLRFLRALYCVDGSLRELTGTAASQRACPTGGGARAAFVSAHPALFHASGYALHLYPFGAVAPNVSTPQEPDYADLATVGRFGRTLDTIVSAYGSSQRFAIYDTEFGYKTNPPYTAGAPSATAAAYLNWAEYLHWRDPRIRTYDQYLLLDPSGQSNFATGLYYLDGTPKPSLEAFRMPLYLPVTSAARGTKVEVWGDVREADVARAATGHTQRATLEYAPVGGAFHAVQTIALTDPAGYFDLKVALPGTGTVRVAWRSQSGPVLTSRTVAVTVR